MPVVRSGKTGLEVRLHALEAALMDVVWRRNWAEFSVSDVLAVLEKDREIAYTTVMTTLHRLSDKGLLARRLSGKRYLYSALLTREGFLEATARDVLDGTLQGSQVIAMLAEKVSDASIEELDQLERLIRERRRELK